MSFQYNPKQDRQPFKSFRLTISNGVLIEAIQDIRIETGQTDKEIMKNALISYLEEQGQITVD